MKCSTLNPLIAHGVIEVICKALPEDLWQSVAPSCQLPNPQKLQLLLPQSRHVWDGDQMSQLTLLCANLTNLKLEGSTLKSEAVEAMLSGLIHLQHLGADPREPA